jgi:hypothetical protein
VQFPFYFNYFQKYFFFQNSSQKSYFFFIIRPKKLLFFFSSIFKYYNLIFLAILGQIHLYGTGGSLPVFRSKKNVFEPRKSSIHKMKDHLCRTLLQRWQSDGLFFPIKTPESSTKSIENVSRTCKKTFYLQSFLLQTVAIVFTIHYLL